jgi:zinc transporter, ZIP family
MLGIFQNFSPITQAFVAGCFTWAMTGIGAAAVFIVKGVNRKVLDTMLGFASGIMLAVIYWSLLAPAIGLAEGGSLPVWVPAAVGFLAGGIFLRVIDKLLPHLHPGFLGEEVEGIKTSWRRNTLFVLAMVLHNIPEGLAIGVAFGAIAAGFHEATLATAIALAVGIGIQDVPEGLAVSVTLRGNGVSRLKSFWYGLLSAVVEPVAAVIGAVGVIFSRPALPYALAFAAGAMVFVVIEEIIPESQRSGNKHLATIGVMVGFVIMMILEVAFGQNT